jgi:hypothetical protein
MTSSAIKSNPNMMVKKMDSRLCGNDEKWDKTRKNDDVYLNAESHKRGIKDCKVGKAAKRASFACLAFILVLHWF